MEQPRDHRSTADLAMPARSEIDEQALIRWHIRETIERYLTGIDMKSLDVIAASFTADAVADYHHGTPEARRVSGAAEIARDLVDSCASLVASNHTLSNCAITVDGTKATADTFAIAHLVRGDRILVRGLHYRDWLAAEPSGWRIMARVHTPLWQFEQAAHRPRFF